MKFLICAYWFVSSIAFGAVSELTIQGFTFLYHDPAGTGTAQSFRYNESHLGDGPRVDVEKLNQSFKIIVTGTENHEFLITSSPEFIQQASLIDIRNLNVSIADRLSLNLSYGKFESPDDTIELKDFSLSCDKTLTEGESGYIEGCIKKMNLKSKQFSSDGESQGKNVLSIVGNSLLKATESKSLTIKSVDFKMTNGKFDLSADIKAQISGSAKGFGNVSYDKVAKKLTIKLSEVKFGFLDVTSQVFDELKKQESETMKVKKPYIYYQLK